MNWISIVYKNPSQQFPVVNGTTTLNPNMDMEVILNGKVVLRKTVYNKYSKDFPKNIPKQWLKKYPKIHWIVIACIHYLNSQSDKKGCLEFIKKDKRLNKDDIGFITDYHSYFKDNIDLSVSYPNGNVKRNDNIAYTNGYDFLPDPKNPELTDFELVQSFAVTKGKVTNNILKSWLDKKSNYDTNNYMKAAYGTFLTALMVIGSHDKNADKVAPTLNAKWTRNKPTLVMNGITQNQAYIHTPDASMGMEINATDSVNPSIDDKDMKIKAFRFACSSALSLIEDNVLKSEAFPVNSVLMGMGKKMMNGTVINIEDKGTDEIVRTYNDNNTKIVIDSRNYLVKETIGSYKGSTSTVPAYCYHNIQTQLATKLGSNIVNNKCEWLGIVSGLTTTMGATIVYMTQTGTIPPDNKKQALGVALGAAGVLGQYLDSGLVEAWDNNEAAKLLVGIGLSLVPLYGSGGGTVGELIVSYVGKDGIKREVTHVPGNFEGYVITTMKVRPGEAFKGGKSLEPIYVVSAQYIKYGVPEAVLKTAIGKTPQEAIREFVKSESIQKGSNVIIDNYNPDEDKYDSQKYKNIQEYLNKSKNT